MAVATFTIEAVIKHADQHGTETVTRRQNERDTMEVTEMFVRHLNGAGMTVIDRQETDARLAEHRYTASGLVEDDTAPSMGNELGARTLIVGRYQFDAAGALTDGEGGRFVKPDRVFSQRVTIKAFDLEKARVLCSGDRAADEALSAGRLLPRSLSRDAAKRLVAVLGSGAGP